MKRSPLNTPGRSLAHGLEWVSRYSLELWCMMVRAAPPVIVKLDSSEFDRGRGHVEAVDMILENIRSGAFNPEHAGEVSKRICDEVGQ
jgi:hypothetical protein